MDRFSNSQSVRARSSEIHWCKWIKAEILRPFFLFIFLLFSSQFLFGQGGQVNVVSPTGGIRIEGDLRANTPTTGQGDWFPGVSGSGGHVFTVGGPLGARIGVPVNPSTSFYFRDALGGNDNSYAQSQDFNSSPNDWTWGIGNVQNKNDLGNVFVHISEVESGINKGQWIFVGADRLFERGSANVDFEFLQGSITPIAGTNDFAVVGPNGGRTVGDFMISVDFENDGGNPQFYTWQSIGGGSFAWVLSDPGPNAFIARSGVNNSLDILSTYGKTNYAEEQFVEAAVNFTALLDIVGDPCNGLTIGNIFIKSRASGASQQSTLSDFVEPVAVRIILGESEFSYNPDDFCGISAPVTFATGSIDEGTFSVNIPYNQQNGVGLTIDPNTGAIDLTKTFPGTYEISFDYFSVGGNQCPKTETITITIPNKAPAPSPQTFDFCEDSGDHLLSITPSSGYSLKWYDQNDNPLPGAPTVNTSSAGTFTYKVSQIKVGECESEKALVTVNVGSCAITLVKGYTNILSREGCLDPSLNPTINYTFAVSLGAQSSPLSSISVIDPKVATISYQSGDTNTNNILEVGETWIFTGSYTILSTDIEAGKVENQATAKGTFNGFEVSDLSGTAVDNDTPTVVPICQDAEIEIIKVSNKNPIQGEDCVDLDLGETITYTFTVTNKGNTQLSNVVVEEESFSGAGNLTAVTFVSSSMGSPAGTLKVGEVATYTATYQVQQEDIDNGLISNQAKASATGAGQDIFDLSSPSTSAPEGLTEVVICQDSAVDLQKDGTYVDFNNDGVASAGDKITYVFTVKNIGNVTLTDITVTDANPAVTVTGGPIASLAPGASDATITGEYTLTQSDIDAGTFTNVATAAGEDPNGSPVSDDDDDDQTFLQLPNVTINKVLTQNENTLGGNLTFDITVTNTGNVTLYGVYVEDVQTGDNWTIAELAPNQSDSRTISVTISQALIDGGCYENTAIAEVREFLDSQETPGENSISYQVVLRAQPSTVTTCFTQSPAIELLKDGVFNDENNDGFGNVGETITYSFVVTNTGNVTLSNVKVTDPKVVVMGGPVSLQPGQSDDSSFTAIYTLTQTDLDNGFVINVALAEGTAPDGEVVEDESSDPTPVEEPSTECTTCTETEIPQNPDVEIVKTDNGAVVDAAGDVITYTLTVTNNGNLTLTNVIITDPLTKYTENVGSLAPGQSAVRTTSYTVTQADVDAGLVLNTAEVTTESPDGENPQDETEEETPIQRTATLIIEKSDNNAAVSVAGDVITYTLTATNTGNVTLTNVIITDPLTKLDENVGTLAPGQSVTRSTSYTVTQADVDAGFVLNTAFVDSESPEGENPSDDDEVETPINRVSDILITKVADLDGVTDAGEVITYTITVTNTGNTSLTNVAVKDPKTGLSEVIPTLVPGQSVSFETTYTVTIDDIAAQETILNVATATYTDPVTDEEKSEEAEELVDVICIDRTLITGTIFNDMTGEPLAGVPVTLVPQGNTPGAIQIVVTGADGRYTFKDFPAGSYLVQVQDANLNAARGLFPVESSLFFTDIQVCIYQTQNFGYETYDGVVLGDFVWYDINGDGIQNEWYDANNDGQVTQNPIQGEAIDLSMWEWFDLNGDGRYDGPENEGELNKGGFGNAQSSNIIVTGPNGYEDDVIVGIIGYWRTRPENSELGDYTATLNIDEFLAAEAERMRGTGLIKVLPDADARMTDINASRTEVRCGATTGNEITRTVTATEQVFLDMDFGIRCLDAEVQIIANDDQFGDHLISFGGVIGNILDNDLLEGQRPDPADVDFEFTELDGIIGLLIDENGELSLIPGVNEVRDYTLGYTLRETAFPDNSDDALVFFRILSDSVDLSVTKTSFGVEVYEGDEFEYEIVVSNIGDTPATNVTIVDNLPASVTYISSRVESVSSQQIQVGAPTVNGSTITWNVPFLPASGVITLRVRVRAGDPGSIQNVVVVDSEEDETDASNNTDTDVNQVLPFHIPNVITPNNDGDNDTFEIRGLGKFAANEIVIFNRYGDHVLEKENYQNDWNAPGQVAGTYFYVLKVTDRSGRAHDFKGWIQVIKE